MRDVFGQYYRPDQDGLRRLMTHATVVPDANVLLGLYRLPASEREQVLGVFDKVQDRLWLPYQAGLEYQRNRLGVVAQQAANYEQVRAIYGARTLDEMLRRLAGLNLPEEVRSEVEGWLPSLVQQIRTAVGRFEESVDALTNQHVVTVAQAKRHDPVRERLDLLFPSSRVGGIPSAEVREQRVKEGLRRSEAKIPPGYKDADKDSDERKAGDFLIWSEILDFAQDSESPVLFVTSDHKEDWFARFGGEVLGPRPELVTEFAKHSPHGYHQVTLADFLDLANDFLSTTVDRATIDRVGEPVEEGLDDTARISAAERALLRYWASGREDTMSPGAYVEFLSSLSNEDRNRLVHGGSEIPSPDLLWLPLLNTSRIDPANVDRNTQAKLLRKWLETGAISSPSDDTRDRQAGDTDSDSDET